MLDIGFAVSRLAPLSIDSHVDFGTRNRSPIIGTFHPSGRRYKTAMGQAQFVWQLRHSSLSKGSPRNKNASLLTATRFIIVIFRYLVRGDLGKELFFHCAIILWRVRYPNALLSGPH